MKPYYEQDGVTIYHGDCLTLEPHANVDLVLTDPMYGNRTNIKGASSARSINRFSKGTQIQARDWDLLAADDRAFDPTPWLTYPEAILWGGNYYSARLPNARCWIIWDKRVNTPPDDNADCEMAWTNIQAPARIVRHLWRGVMRAGEENIAVSGAKLHPFQKPAAVMTFCLSLSRTHGTVLDPFMGSGTTLLAARRAGRRAIGVELEERFCEIAARRLSTVLGAEAV